MNEEKDNDAIEAPETEAVLQQETLVPADEAVDEKGEINRLLDEGYSVKQIIDLGFKRRTVYHYAKLRVKPENEPTSGNDTSAPSSNGRVKHEMIKLGSKDVIPPEAVLDVLHLPQNGDAVEVWRRGVLDGVGILLLGARYSQLTAAGQTEIVKNQLDILREAKSDSKEVAHAAAEEAAWRVGQQVQEMVQQTAKPESPNPMASMFTNAIQPYFSQALGKMFGMFGGFGTPGGMMQPPAGQPGQTQPSGAQPSSIPPGSKQISNEEMEAAFNDG
ncbi:hypothetical protein ACFLV0_05560 [Chloroflexota bacterium]